MSSDVLADEDFLYLTHGAIRPENPVDIGLLLVFPGCAPSLAELTAHIATRLPDDARLRLRATGDPQRRRGWTITEPDLARMVTEHVLAQGAELDAVIARVFESPVDTSAGNWRVLLVHGHRADEFAVLVRWHHSMMDIISGIRLLERIFGDTPPPSDARPRRAAPSAGGAGAALRMFLPRTRALPWHRPTASGRILAWHSDIELVRVRAIGRAEGGTVNDVFVTAVAEALTGVLRRTKTPMPRGIAVFVPSDVFDGPGERPLGNALSAFRVYVPTGPEGVPRLPEVVATTRRWKAAAADRTVLPGLNLVARAPRAIRALALRTNFGPGTVSALASNAPGPRIPLYWRGHEPTALVPVNFLPVGHSLSFIMSGYRDRLSVTVVGDGRSGTLAAELAADIRRLLRGA